MGAEARCTVCAQYLRPKGPSADAVHSARLPSPRSIVEGTMQQIRWATSRRREVTPWRPRGGLTFRPSAPRYEPRRSWVSSALRAASAPRPIESLKIRYSQGPKAGLGMPERTVGGSERGVSDEASSARSEEDTMSDFNSIVEERSMPSPRN